MKIDIDTDKLNDKEKLIVFELLIEKARKTQTARLEPEKVKRKRRKRPKNVPNKCRRWSLEDKQKVYELKKNGHSNKEIGNIMGRSNMSIWNILQKHKEKQNSFLKMLKEKR